VRSILGDAAKGRDPAAERKEASSLPDGRDGRDVGQPTK
jgi:hypothetical protein